MAYERPNSATDLEESNPAAHTAVVHGATTRSGHGSIRITKRFMGSVGLALMATCFNASCSGSGQSTPPGQTGVLTGGASSVGGSTAIGGTGVSTGGTSNVGGTTSIGGTLMSGGNSSQPGGASAAGGSSSSVGGTTATGGSKPTGGVTSTGGKSTAGGTSAAGGSSSTGGKTSGGSSNTGGSSATTGGTNAGGGSTATGGSKPTGGTVSTGGTTATGGSKPTGGTTSTGGTKATGGTSAAGGSSRTGKWQIMPLGDSITASTCYPQLLSQELINKSHSNFQFVGNSTNNQSCNGAPNVKSEGHGGYLVTYLETDSPPQSGKGKLSELVTWAAEKPEVVFMHYGTNDVWNNISTSNILKGYDNVLSHFRGQNPSVIFFVAQIIPMNPDGCGNCESNVQALNAAIPSWASGTSTSASPVYVVDVHSALPASSYTPSSTYTSDGVHPNASGAQLMADKMYAALVAQLSGL